MPFPIGDDYYALLGVHTAADGEELRRAWRRLAARWHPDRAGDEATAIFQQLSAAYAVLSDPIERAAYDRRRGMAAGDVGKTTTRPSPRAAPGMMLSRISGPLASLAACGVARVEEPGYITLMLNAREAAQGGMATISMRVALWCPDCHARPGVEPAACRRCGGTRTVEELFSAWLAVPPGVTGGEVLVPSAELPGMVAPVRFRVRLIEAAER